MYKPFSFLAVFKLNCNPSEEALKVFSTPTREAIKSKGLFHHPDHQFCLQIVFAVDSQKRDISALARVFLLTL